MSNISDQDSPASSSSALSNLDEDIVKWSKVLREYADEVPRTVFYKLACPFEAAHLEQTINDSQTDFSLDTTSLNKSDLTDLTLVDNLGLFDQTMDHNIIPPKKSSESGAFIEMSVQLSETLTKLADNTKELEPSMLKQVCEQYSNGELQKLNSQLERRINELKFLLKK